MTARDKHTRDEYQRAVMLCIWSDVKAVISDMSSLTVILLLAENYFRN
jgi:hypothetical protein